MFFYTSNDAVVAGVNASVCERERISLAYACLCQRSIKVFDDYLYMFDKVTTSVERFQLNVDKLEVKKFGPALFYRIHSFTVYSDALAALTRKS